MATLMLSHFTISCLLQGRITFGLAVTAFLAGCLCCRQLLLFSDSSLKLGYACLYVLAFTWRTSLQSRVNISTPFNWAIAFCGEPSLAAFFKLTHPLLLQLKGWGSLFSTYYTRPRFVFKTVLQYQDTSVDIMYPGASCMHYCVMHQLSWWSAWYYSNLLVLFQHHRIQNS